MSAGARSSNSLWLTIERWVVSSSRLRMERRPADPDVLRAPGALTAALEDDIDVVQCGRLELAGVPFEV